MSVPITNFASKSTIDPLEDDEFSDLTKQEIAFWSHKLKIRPSQLFSLSKDKLEIILQNAIRREGKQERITESQRWENISEMKKKLIEKQRKERLKGGAGPDLWTILAQAAKEIEHMYGSSYRHIDSSCDMTYDSSFDESPFNYSLYSDEEASYESAPDDYSFNIDQNLASTPYNPRGKRQLPSHDTYCVPNADATYNVPQAKATFNVSHTGRNATFNCPKTSFKLENITPPPSMRSNTYSSPYNLADVSLPPGMELNNWSPQQLHHLEDNSGVSQAPSFRNYTDYSIQYSPVGTEETANSISVEHYDDSSGKVTASSRTFTLPPATTPTSALELSNITPPTLATGCIPRTVRGMPLANDNDLANISQPLLASGCIKRETRTKDLSNISQPALASGCRTNVRGPMNSPEFLRRNQGVETSRTRCGLSNVTPPVLASGCVRQSPRNASRQFRDVPPSQLSCGRCPTESSFDIANISAPADISSTPRCPVLSAYRAKTPMRVKPNRPYRPRRICEEE